MPTAEKRFRLVQDDDCHWYIIPANELEIFNQWLAHWEGFGEWEGIDFSDCMINGSPEQYTFTDPQRDKQCQLEKKYSTQ